MKNHFLGSSLAVLCAGMIMSATEADACTGISLTAKDGSHVLARTCEWGGSDLESRYVIVPRNSANTSLTPSGQNGLEYVTRYGYVGISVTQDSFVTEGMNETGLSAGLFFFPGYGQYEEYDSSLNSSTMDSGQFLDNRRIEGCYWFNPYSRHKSPGRDSTLAHSRAVRQAGRAGDYRR